MLELMDLDQLRERFERDGLRRADLDPDPFVQFRRWFDLAIAAGHLAADAMVVATVDADGWPDARNVLLKDLDEWGFVFYTNLASPKASQIHTCPRAALVFTWHGLRRQIRVRGDVELVADDAADEYWASRPRGSRIGAWASEQSRVLASRAELDQRVLDATRRYDGREVPRPPDWGGLRVVPAIIEFWQGRPERLHDRFRYARSSDGAWVIDRLSP